MSDKFQIKYHIPSAWLKNWDYGSHAMYFNHLYPKPGTLFWRNNGWNNEKL